MESYKQDWQFDKFAELLYSDSHKQRIHDLYCVLDLHLKKRLFLYLSDPKANKIICDLLKSDGFLTLKGITNILQEEGIYEFEYKFFCQNYQCEHNQNPIFSNNFIYKKCPRCSSKVILNNKKKIIETFCSLYLNYFDFYLLNEANKTIYIVRNKFSGKFYMKTNDESLANWLYIKLKENNCPVDFFLFCNQQGKKDKALRHILMDFLKDNTLIKTIDNLNFKPVREFIFEEDGKKYFNLYTGNPILNSKCENNGEDFISQCPNILELLYNLTGKNEEGVKYVIDILAMIVQEPHIKTKQLIIFYGEEASGKGTFYDLILSQIFYNYITKILGKKIKSTFNGYMSKNLILVLEEVKADKEEEDTLKELVTEDKILINEKNLPERYENNYLTVFGFSNEQNPVAAGKRRGVYFRSRTLGGTVDKAPEFRSKYEKQIPKELPYFIKELKTRKYNRIEIMKGCNTEAKKQVQEQNMSLVHRFYNEMCEFPSLARYVDFVIENHRYDMDLDLSKMLYSYNEIMYVEANFIVGLYNLFLKKQKYKAISLNKFSEFWQLIKIDRDNKEHFTRFRGGSGRKMCYVNLGIIDAEIKLRYEEDD